MPSFAAGSGKTSYPQRTSELTFKPIDSIYQDRLRQFIDENGHYKDLMLPKLYTKETLQLKAKPSADDDVASVNTSYLVLKHWAAPGLSKPLFKDVVPPNFQSSNYSMHMIHLALPGLLTVPESFINEKEIWLVWDAGCEGMVFNKDGKPLQGLTGDGERIEFIIPNEWYESGREYTFYLEMGCNGMFGTTKPIYDIKKCEIQVPNLQAHALYYDFWILSDCSREGSSPQKFKA
ncbi:hypothetical protein HII12_001508, partial [Brettanomyces bruxellensis]